MRGKIHKYFRLFAKRTIKSDKFNKEVYAANKYKDYKTLDLFRATLRMAKATLKSFWIRHRVLSRIGALLLAMLIFFTVILPVIEEWTKTTEYNLEQYNSILGEPSQFYASKLAYDNDGVLTFNKEYNPTTEDISGDSASPKVSATFGAAAQDHKITVMDPENQVSLELKPKDRLGEPKKSDNRVVYPLKNKKAIKVYTVGASGIKEDIIFDVMPKQDTLTFEYEISTAESIEIRQENDGSIGAYGVESVLLGNISTGTEADQKLLESARQNGEKNNLLFRIPAPFIVQADGAQSNARTWYSLSGNTLTLHADGLHGATYPLSIDPTIYVESARKLMRGNNETNVDFDTTNELIQKSRTTGARIDGWQDTAEMDAGLWDHAVATAGGFIYRAGGRIDPTMPYVVGQQATTAGTASTSFVMNMPTTRPAGDLYIALIAKDGTGTVTDSSGTWTEYADNDAGGGNTREHAAYWKIGTDQGGGNEASTYTFTSGSSVQWAGVIIRIKGFNAGSPISGSAGRTFGATDVVPQFPAVTPSHDATLIIRAAAIDDDEPSEYTWLPNGHTRLYSATSSENSATSVGLVATSLDQPPLATNVAAAQSLVNDGILVDTFGSSSIAIRPATVTAGYENNVEWAQFDEDNLSLASPNPGNGVCTGWCTDTDYDLPANRVGMSMVAYNGYLYALGGTTDGTAANGRNTVWIAKLGANGEPQLWHPTDTDANNWVYWYSSVNTLPSARSYSAIAAYKNRLYLVGGRDTAGSSINDVHVADFQPNGDIGAWSTSGMQNLSTPTARFGHSVHIYNDAMYIIGGNNSGTLRNTVFYSKLSATGSMNSWVQTSSFATARTSFGGTMTSVWGAYIYLAGGCSALTSGFCSTIQSDVQLASINADGSLGPWNSISNLSNQRIGYSFVAWQGGLYRFGGCNRQNTTTGFCFATHRDVEYGPVNPEGDASTVSNSEPANTAPCSGVTPTNCDLPGAGDGLEQGGQMSSALAINNGYIYIIGGCTFVAPGTAADDDGESCENGTTNNDRTSGNVLYAELNASGVITRPATCSGTYVTNSLWCVDSQNLIYEPTALYSVGTLSQTGTTVTGTGTTWVAAHVGRTLRYADGTTALITARASNTSITVNVSKTVAATTTYGFHVNGIAAASASVFNNVLYVAGGTDGTNWKDEVFRVGLNSDGSLAGAWESQTFAGLGLTGTADDQRGYMYTFTRANPASASTNPGNYYMLGGCRGGGSAADDGIGCGAYYTDVIKCNIGTDTSLNTCTTTGQLQIDADNVNPGSQGIGLMAGSVYANRVYLVGGACTEDSTPVNPTDPCAPAFSGNRRDTIYARIDDSNNIVDNTSGLSSGSWAFTTGQMDPVRRRAVAFGYNGHIYSLAGFSGTASLQDLLFAKINVSTGDMGSFSSSGVVVTPRWDLRAIVNNGYVYAIGGCGTGKAPIDCQFMQPEIQTFQLYNNDSGSAVDYAPSANLFTTDRMGASSTILNGYLYVAGGCTSTSDCSAATNSVQYSQIDANGNLGAWAAGGNLPASLTWGQLEAVGGTLYYIGGQNGAGAAQSTVYYTTGISSGNPTWSGTAATQALPAARSQHSATVWNNRIYVTGGSGSGGTCAAVGVCDTVYYSSDLSGGGNITGAWTTSTAFNVDRSGHTTIAYANNLYVLGGYNGAEYLNDVQYASIGYKTGTITQTNAGAATTTITGSGTVFAPSMVGATLQYGDGATTTISSYVSPTQITVSASRLITSASNYVILDGSVGSWSYTTSLPKALRNADGFAANGYMYLIGGRDASGECTPTTLVGPISANTTIATRNNPTGIGEWYETNESYGGDRYGAAVAYAGGKVYVNGGACGFPSVSKINTQGFNADTTDHIVNMPSTVDAGDLLITLITSDGNATITDPDGAGGWTQVRTQVNGTAVRGTVYAKDAVGNEDSARINFATSATEEMATQVIRIPASKWNGNIADIEASTGATGSSTTPDPDSLTASWGVANNLWFAFVAGSSFESVTASPTNFGDTYHVNTGTVVGDASASSSRFESAVATLNPGSYTVTPTNDWVAITIAVRPATFAYTGANRSVQSAVFSQPQIAMYSRLIDTDSNVFPNSWLANGIDNSIGARWQAQYRTTIEASNTVFHRSFDEGTNGGTLPATGSGLNAYDSCYNNGTATRTYSNAWNVTPSLSASFTTPGGTGNFAGCFDSYSDTSVRYERFYFRMNGVNPGFNTTIFSLDDNTTGSQQVMDLRITTGGLLQIRNNFTASTTLNIDTGGQANRIEVGLSGGRVWVRVFRESTGNLNSFVPDSQATFLASADTQTDTTTIGLLTADITSTAWSTWFDEHKVSQSAWVGPASPAWGQNITFGNVVMGDVAAYTPLAPTYSVGTITQSGTTVTAGAGTRFTTEMIGATIRYQDNTTDTITAVANSGATMTVSNTKTIAAPETFLVSNINTNFGRWYYFFLTIDASQTFGYPEDVERGPTLSDLSLFFTSDPNKRLRHGKTFTGGEQQPLDTPCRQSVDPQCPLP